MLVVMPGFTFYWPDWNRSLLAVFSMASKFCIKVDNLVVRNYVLYFYLQVMGHPAAEPVSPQQLMQVGFIMFLIMAILFHLFISWLGF